MKSLFANSDISLQPFRDDLVGSTWQSLRCDLIAGCHVALLTMPQVMAYALIAGLPLTCGLFGAIFATMIAALLGSSRHLIVGPTNTIAILVQTATAEILFTYYRDVIGPARELLSLQIVTQLTLLVGIFQIFAAISGLGRLTQFVSHSVVIGYITGTAIALGVSQLFSLFGVPASDVPLSVSQKVAYLLTHLNQMQAGPLLIGSVFLALLLIPRLRKSRFPVSALLLVLSAGLFYLLRQRPELYPAGWLEQVQLVGDVEAIVGFIPKLTVFPFDINMLNMLFPTAIAIALLGMLEASAIGKTTAANSGQQLSVNQEVYGLGVGNFVAGLMGSMPSSGSPSRTRLNYQYGAKTRFSAFFSGGALFLIVFALGQFINYIPLAAFAALLLVTAYSLVDRRQFMLCLRSHRSDAVVLGTTVLACLIFSIDVAFFIGIGLSITFYLNKAAMPYLVEHLVDEAGEMRGTESPGTTRDKAVRIISVQGELFFGAADLFQTTLKTLAAGDQQTRVLILRLKHARDVDATACLALSHLNRYLKESGRYLVGCSITAPVWEVLCNSGVAEEIGKDNLFLYDPQMPQLSVKQAWQRARELAGREVKPASPGVAPVVAPAPAPISS
jgi:SulP family sulfate permease